MPRVEVESAGSIATLVLNRPELRNALDIGMCDEIVDALASIDGEGEARALIIRGRGKTFCAGADFAAISGPGGIDFVPAFERMLEAVGRYRLPTIAAIHGVALGGGLQLATACDFRIAADDAKLGIPAAKLGILVNYGNIRRLVLLVGQSRAKKILMTGRAYSASEALEMGLVEELVPKEQVLEQANAWAGELSELAPLSVQGSKKAIQAVVDRTAGHGSESDEAAIDALVVEAYNSSDLQEGLRALSEKRPPKFEGR